MNGIAANQERKYVALGSIALLRKKIAFCMLSLCLGCQGLRLDQHAFSAMVQAFDPDRNGQLGLAEFIAMTLFLKSAAATFAAFDPQQAGRITLDFSQFIYAASNIR